MPIYIYKCNLCECITEVIQRISDEPLKDCGLCNQPETLEKQIVQTAPPKFIGSGFHQNDYKKYRK